MAHGPCNQISSLTHNRCSSQLLFNSPHAIIRIDVLEYLEKHSITRLWWEVDGIRAVQALQHSPY